MPAVRVTEEAGVRYLQFSNHWIQGAMRVSRPWALELAYTRELMMPLLLRRGQGWPRSVLQVGLGAGSITKFLYRHLPKAHLTVVEIDPEVLLAAWSFFRLPEESARLTIEIADGHRYMAATRRKYDLILVDGFDAEGRAGVLDTLAFYRRCRARLTDEGLLATNLIGRPAEVAASIARMGRVFEGRVLALPPDDVNTVAIAAVGAPIRTSAAALRKSANRLRARMGLNLLPTVARLDGESGKPRRKGAKAQRKAG
jgi:spermidine synthase